MQRLVRVSSHQNDCEQTEESTQYSLQTITRITVGARRVIYFHFTEPKSSITRQHRNVAMSLAVHHYFIEYLPPNAFKTAVEIVKADSGEHRGHQVVDLRTQPLAQLIAATVTPTANDVIPVLKFLEQQGQLLGYILKIGIHRDDYLVTSGAEPSRECRRLAKISAKANVPDRLIDGSEIF